jgi:hypothetical protein
LAIERAHADKVSLLGVTGTARRSTVSLDGMDTSENGKPTRSFLPEWLGIGIPSAIFFGLGAFELYAGYSFGRHGPVSRSDHPYQYWFLTVWCFVMGFICIVSGCPTHLLSVRVAV